MQEHAEGKQPLGAHPVIDPATDQHRDECAEGVEDHEHPCQSGAEVQGVLQEEDAHKVDPREHTGNRVIDKDGGAEFFAFEQAQFNDRIFAVAVVQPVQHDERKACHDEEGGQPCRSVTAVQRQAHQQAAERGADQ
ncbi:hypothetical protein D9M71_740050 [compost metagenome]